MVNERTFIQYGLAVIITAFPTILPSSFSSLFKVSLLAWNGSCLRQPFVYE